MSNEQIVDEVQNGVNVEDNMLQLWQQNKGFIYKTAKKYSQYAEMDDLLQEGYLGLCEAVKHYEPEQETTFLRYASFWIKQQMYRYVENCCSVIRISSGTRAEVLRYKKIYAEYRKQYGKDPTDREIRAFLGVSLESLENVKKALRISKIESLSNPMAGKEDELLLSDMVASDEDVEETVIEQLDKEQMRKELWKNVDSLPEEQGELLRKRYQNKMTLKEIGWQLGVSIERTRQISEKALRAMRMPKRSKKLRKYYEIYLSAASSHHVGVQQFQCTWESEVERDVLRKYEYLNGMKE